MRIILVMFMKNYTDLSPLWQNTPLKFFWSICSNVYTVYKPLSATFSVLVLHNVLIQR